MVWKLLELLNSLNSISIKSFKLKLKQIKIQLLVCIWGEQVTEITHRKFK